MRLESVGIAVKVEASFAAAGVVAWEQVEEIRLLARVIGADSSIQAVLATWETPGGRAVTRKAAVRERLAPAARPGRGSVQVEPAEVSGAQDQPGEEAARSKVVLAGTV